MNRVHLYQRLASNPLANKTLAARGLEEHVSFPDFCDNRQFYVFYCVYSCLDPCLHRTFLTFFFIANYWFFLSVFFLGPYSERNFI
jgi:hypothetical protein